MQVQARSPRSSHNDRDLDNSLREFLDERQGSIEWLTGLGDPDLEAFETPLAAGKLQAGDVLAAWVAHDLLHLRQLIELKYFLVEDLASPYSTQYAGEF